MDDHKNDNKEEEPYFEVPTPSGDGWHPPKDQPTYPQKGSGRQYLPYPPNYGQPPYSQPNERPNGQPPYPQNGWQQGQTPYPPYLNGNGWQQGQPPYPQNGVQEQPPYPPYPNGNGWQQGPSSPTPQSDDRQQGSPSSQPQDEQDRQPSSPDQNRQQDGPLGRPPYYPPQNGWQGQPSYPPNGWPQGQPPYPQNGWGGPPYPPYPQNGGWQQPPYNGPQKPQPDNLSTAAMIVSVISIMACCWSPLIQFTLAMVAIVLVILSRQNGPFNTYSKTGLVLAIIAIIMSFVTVYLMGVVRSPEFQEYLNSPEMQDMFREFESLPYGTQKP